jgi:hypothetical protein
MILSVLCLASLAAPLWCADPQSTPAASAQNNSAVSATDLETLKQKIADQQEQIKKLQDAMNEQQRLLERSMQTLEASSKAAAAKASTSDGTKVVETSTTNVAGPVRLVPALGGNRSAPAYPSGGGGAQNSAANPCESENASPTFLRIGNTCVVPIGFMDMTGVWRDKNAASQIGTSFGSVPYNNSVAGQNSEFRFSPQNSRIGFRIDGDWKGTHFIGYNEFDFLGMSAANNIGVTNGAFVPRIRLFWVDVRKGKVEFLAGQSWSMLTPNRTGISALPGDLFYSQVTDVNYMAGLTWTRQAGLRVLFHPSHKATLGLSFENPSQYMGGSSGGGQVVLPSAAALNGLGGTQLDNASNALATPTVAPDIIAKLALDPSSRFHFEVAGLFSSFKIWNSATSQHFSTEGGGVQVGLNAEVVKHLRLITTNYWSDGGGRYLFGQAPDVMVRADGGLSLIHSGGTVDGFEATIKNTLLYAYYGGIFIGRDVAIDSTGKPIGYGYTGSPNSQNRAIQEGTIGFNHTFWKNPKYGAINLMGQYEYATRSPWYVALGSPKAAHDNTIYFNIRYSLPGSMPNF